jgi:hypothetical protein
MAQVPGDRLVLATISVLRTLVDQLASTGAIDQDVFHRKASSNRGRSPKGWRPKQSRERNRPGTIFPLVHELTGPGVAEFGTLGAAFEGAYVVQIFRRRE